MKRGIRMFLPILMTLAMVLSIFGMTIPVMASQITATKEHTAPLADFYYVGDTIYYEMTVQNPPANSATNTLVEIWDTLPDGSVHYFVQEGIDPPLVQAPGDIDYFYLSYQVDEADIIWIPALGGYGVKNKFEARGYDSAGDDVYALVTKNSDVIRPCINIEKTVDCNDDGEFLDEDYGIVGDTGHWRIVVTNCGYDPLYDVGVWDTLFGYIDTIDVLEAGDSVQYDYDTVVNEDTTNWAYVEGYDALGTAWYDEDSATNYVLQPCIDIEKTVDCNDDGIFLDEDYGIVGDTGHWRIVVTNCGEVDLFDVFVFDDNGMSWGPFNLGAGADIQFDYDTVVNEDTTNWAYVEAYDAAGGVWYDEDDATNFVLQPCIDIQKTVDCNDDGIFLDEDYGYPGDTGHWRIVVTNCGECDLFDVYVWDTNGMSWGPFDLAAGQFVQFDYDTIVNETTTNVAYVEGYDEAGGIWYDEDDATNVVTGGEGCTPGFWKNNAVNWEAVAWGPTGYAPGDSFEAVFGVDVTLRGAGRTIYTTPTLLQALSATGGGINALARHAVAALLNISHADIAYAGGMNVAGLIAAVQDAVAEGEDGIEALHIELAEYNEAGCSINQQGEPIMVLPA